MIEAFRSWMNQSVSISASGSMDKFGTFTFGTATSTKCYIESKPRKVVSATGIEVVSSATIYLSGNANYNPKMRILLPDGTTPPVLKIEQIVNERGILEMSVVYV
jgi:hypothetical protein